MLSGAAATASLFDQIDFSKHRTIVAAVSGGSDSTALLVLLRENLVRVAPQVRIVAVTVDHALRGGSAGEAEQVAAFCKHLGVDHVIKIWSGAKPATGLAAAARDARYRLLAEVAGESGSTLIFTGHTADDQAETVHMRSQRGDGLGLAGMAPATLLDGRFWLVRPLLGERRSALRDKLSRQNIGWIDDPSNENAVYERVRARRDLNRLGDVEALLAKANAAARRRIGLGHTAAEFILANASQPVSGLIRLAAAVPPPLTPPRKGEGDSETMTPPSPLRGGVRGGGELGEVFSDEAATHALRLLLAVVGGRSELPSEDATDALLAKLASGARRATLSRAVVDMRAGHVWLYRESRGLPEPRTASNGEIWDGRFRLKVDGDPLVTAGRPTSSTGDANVPPALQRAAAAALPVLHNQLGNNCVIPVAAPWARFLPSFDLAPARAILRLIGGELPPPLPYVGHSEGGA